MESITVTFVKPGSASDDSSDAETGDTGGSEESTTPVPYELEVKNFCTDDTVTGVTVYLDGTDMGQTDSDGIISLGALLPGSTHTLKMIKDGYIDSDKDHIDNASFTVPSS